MTYWVIKDVALAIHDRQIAEHGGSPGLRDEGRLEAALDRPKNLAAYDDPDICALAAAYALGIAQTHPFVDGNKRTSAVVTELFLNLNGFHLTADDAAIVTTWLSIASGTMSEDRIADWLRLNSSSNA